VNFPFPIIDPHIHQWDILKTPRILTWVKRSLGWNQTLYETAIRLGAKNADKQYVGRPDFVAYDYLPQNYSADAESLRISHVVHVEAEWRDRRAIGPANETAWLHNLFDNSPLKLGGIVGYVELQSANAEQLIMAHRNASDKFVGVRQMLAFDSDEGIMRFCPQAFLSRDEKWLHGLELLEKHHLVFDAWFFHHQLDELDVLAKSYPGITFVLDHMGSPIGAGGPFSSYGRTQQARDVIVKTWQMGMQRVAENPNVMVKLSGLFMPVIGWGYEHRKAAPSQQELLDGAGPLIEFVLQQFGDQRCMFASNFPMDKVSLSLFQLYEFYAKVVEGRAPESIKKLFHDNAARVYRIKR
jgi:L-fuconolactonase